MASTLLFLLQLILVSLAAASHYFGGSVSFTYKGRNPDGTFKVGFRYKGAFSGCAYHTWPCYRGNCGSQVRRERGRTDSSTNAPRSTKQWCETETVMTRSIPSDKPFQMREGSCCWISTRNHFRHWRLLTAVDLGTRSDTREPNRSPDVATLPLLRVPINCPRSYKLMAFDADGDQVRCRYASARGTECYKCTHPPRFKLDEGSCTLHYGGFSLTSVYGFELVVEDFPQRPITLAYTDGSRSTRSPLTTRRSRHSLNGTAGPWHQTSTPHPTTTSAPTANSNPHRWQQQTRTSPPTQTTLWWWTNSSAITTPTQTTSTKGRVHAYTSPLSKLPLQFSFLVDPVSPSCREGEFLPRFLYPTPKTGQHLQAEVNKEIEIRVKAQAKYAKLHDVIVSGPLHITKHKTTKDQFAIRWTSVTDDLGDHIPICFVAESVAGSRVFQSEMRCVVVEVWRKNVSVMCHESTMTVEVEKSSFAGIREDHLRLNDPSNTVCSLQRHSNSTHIIAVIPLNACGTQIEEDDDNIRFKNEMTTVDNVNDLITRRNLLEVQFYCQYPKRGNVTLGFTAHRNNVTVWEKGFGTFTYEFEFYHSNRFQTKMDPNSYPLEYDVGERIYMEIEATSSINNTELFVESCRAAPYDNPNYKPTYSIIENGCKVDQTVKVYTARHQRHFSFSIEAFKFIGLYNQVYISCSVMVCEAGNPNTRCSRGCIKSTSSRSHRHRHHKREAILQTARHFVSQGPLRLKRSTESTVTKLNLNLVFIAGCLLAAVSMISAVVIHKNKAQRIKYEIMSLYES